MRPDSLFSRYNHHTLLFPVSAVACIPRSFCLFTTLPLVSDEWTTRLGAQSLPGTKRCKLIPDWISGKQCSSERAAPYGSFRKGAAKICRFNAEIFLSFSLYGMHRRLWWKLSEMRM